MRLHKRLEALETRKPNGRRAALIVRYSGDPFTDEDIAEMERAKREGLPPMIIVINRPKPDQPEFCKPIKSDREQLLE